MRIGIFTTEFPYKPPFVSTDLQENQIRYGGVAEVTYNIVLRLEQLGHEVLVFTTSASNKDEYHQYKNIFVFRYGYLFKIGSTKISLRLLWKPLKYHLDIANGHRGSPPGAMSAYIYSKIKNTPLVISIHGILKKQSSFDQTLIKRATMNIFKEYIYAKILERAKCIMVLSKQAVQESDYLSNFYKKISIVPNGVDLDKMHIDLSKSDCRKILSLPQQMPVVIYVGSIVERKGLHILVKAIPMILKNHPDALFILVGDGNYLDQIKKVSRQMNVEESIIFTGFVDENEKYVYYQAGDIFCLPSFSEGYPMVLLEASAFGLPLVVSDIGVHKAIVKDGYNGYIFTNGDSNDLAIKIIDLIDNRSLRSDIESNSRILAQTHSWDVIVKDIEEIFLKFSTK